MVVVPAASDGLAAHAAGHDGRGRGRCRARDADRSRGGTIACARWPAQMKHVLTANKICMDWCVARSSAHNKDGTAVVSGYSRGWCTRHEMEA